MVVLATQAVIHLASVPFPIALQLRLLRCALSGLTVTGPIASSLTVTGPIAVGIVCILRLVCVTTHAAIVCGKVTVTMLAAFSTHGPVMHTSIMSRHVTIASEARESRARPFAAHAAIMLGSVTV